MEGEVVTGGTNGMDRGGIDPFRRKTTAVTTILKALSIARGEFRERHRKSANE
jgi:hypothetical protein